MNEMVAVTWSDAFFDLDARESYPDDYRVTTLGYVLERGPLFLRVASERLPDGWRAITSIPVALIVDEYTLGRVP